MASRAAHPSDRFPSVDALARTPELAALAAAYGHSLVVSAIRDTLSELRSAGKSAERAVLVASATARVLQRATPALRPIFNLTGVVLHTNLGRAALSETAIEQAVTAMRGATNLEFDLSSGARGDRDGLVEDLLIELTGAEASTVVNNNAAAVLITLAALAEGREVVISRGELVEIGGSFRIPDVMRSAHAKLVEVGTTNRTHKKDYEQAIGPETAALMKVHCSNYIVSGFVKSVLEAEVAAVAHAHGLPMITDLGSGSLIDLSAFGLPKEPVVRDQIDAGCDIVTFSGDKLLGGPQAGLIVGKKAFIERIKSHPLKRALRPSKQTYAALEPTLLAYRSPDRLVQTLPTLRHLTRPLADIEALAARLLPSFSDALGDGWDATTTPVKSRIGSGSLPIETIPSMAILIRKRGTESGKALDALAAKLRTLPVPIVGRIANDALLLDLRCLDDEGGLREQLSHLKSMMY